MQTTDNQDEVYDVVDVNDQVVGEAKRWEVHRNKNLIHTNSLNINRAVSDQ